MFGSIIRNSVMIACLGYALIGDVSASSETHIDAG
jgi:hypothetical protein